MPKSSDFGTKLAHLNRGEWTYHPKFGKCEILEDCESYITVRVAKQAGDSPVPTKSNSIQKKENSNQVQKPPEQFSPSWFESGEPRKALKVGETKQEADSRRQNKHRAEVLSHKLVVEFFDKRKIAGPIPEFKAAPRAKTPALKYPSVPPGYSRIRVKGEYWLIPNVPSPKPLFNASGRPICSCGCGCELPPGSTGLFISKAHKRTRRRQWRQLMTGSTSPAPRPE